MLAGAGSGKTRVLTYRIAWLLATGRARPSEVIAITFTNKAAGEMRERVAELVGGVSAAMWVTTFHSACARILRADAQRLGYKRAFTIYDEADSLRMVKRCLTELEHDPKRYVPRAVKSAISSAKNQLVDSADYADAAGGDFEQVIAEVYALYERRMVEASAMDFDDLLVRTVNLLELFSDVLEKYRRIFRWVLVDEYQDTNRAQYRFLQLLAGEHRNLTVVGDEDQSIYGFRHADIRNILDFDRDFGDATLVKLEQNYRSTQTVLDAANAIVANNTERREKRLWTDAGAGRADRRRRVRRRARRGALRRLRGQPAGRGGDAARPDRGLLPGQRPEPGARGHAGAVRHPLPGDRRDEVLRAGRDQGRGRLPAAALQPRRRGLLHPDRQLAAARDRPADPGADPLAREHPRRRCLGGVLTARTALPGLGAAARKAVARFAETMAGLRQRAERAGPVAELLEAVLHESGYVEALEAERTVEAEGRIENLEELVGVAGEFDANRELEGESESTPLEEFLAQISLVSEQDSLREAESLATLMTLHNAKGLEYDAVFVIGCEEGVFPHSRSLEEGDLEEERRLCYVGVTRARRRLCMTYARRRSLHGGSSWNLPSRFLAELPERLVERHVATTATGWPGHGDARARATGFGQRPALGIDVPPAKQRASHRRSRTRSATTSCTRPSARAS